MISQTETIQSYLSKWQDILRLRDWDIRLQVVDTEWRKTGDIKIDDDDRKAVLMINVANPKQENVEGVVIHDLLHLRLWGMDQMIEQLLFAVLARMRTIPGNNLPTAVTWVWWNQQLRVWRRLSYLLPAITRKSHLGAYNSK